MKFSELAKVNVNQHVEKKQNLSYLSWVWAVNYISGLDENAEWEYREWDGKPFLVLPDGTCMVYCTVTLFGRKRTAHLPVMDYKNKAIQNPDAFQVNTAMQRALVKAIALHGLGLYIYAGEDLPKDEGAQLPAGPITPNSGAGDDLTAAQKEKVNRCASDIVDLFEAGDPTRAFEYYAECSDGMDVEEKRYLWSFLSSSQRSAIKKAGSAKGKKATPQELAEQA